MPAQWLTYRQLGELWKTTPEAARVRSRRGNYPRRRSELGAAEVLVEVDDTLADFQLIGDGSDQHSNLRPEFSPEDAARIAIELQTIEQMQELVTSLSEQLTKKEEQLELLRKYLMAEREQVQQLMSVVLRRSGGERTGFLRRLFSWRKREKDPTEHLNAAYHGQAILPPDVLPEPPAVSDTSVHRQTEPAAASPEIPARWTFKPD